MKVVYDAGVLVAIDRNDRQMWLEHRVRLEMGVLPTVTAPVVAQVSRSGRQAQLRRFLRGCQLVPFSTSEAHTVGTLLAQTSTSDVVDAHVVAVAAGGTIITSDPNDIAALAAHAPQPVQIQPI